MTFIRNNVSKLIRPSNSHFNFVRNTSNISFRPIQAKSKSFIRSHTKKIIFGSLVVGATTTYFTNETFHDGINHFYLTLGRVGVVTAATIKCFYHYKKVLSANHATEEEHYEALSQCHAKCSAITLKALEKNGGIYIKLGQHISAMTYLLPKEWTDAMIPLQDKCPESSFEDINQMFIHDLGISIDDMFVNFDRTPIGVASLAQVHIATLRDGNEKVAVKCQHPSLKEFVPLDVYLTQNVFKLLDIFFPEYPLTWLGDELQSSIYVELNFNKEAHNAEKTTEYFKNFQGLTALRIPKVKASTNRILIMEYIKGERLDNLKFMDDNKISRSEVSSCLSHIFNNMIFTPGVGIHCDPHGGNLAIRLKPKDGNIHNTHNFEIVLYDHGLYRDVSTQMRRDYAHFWLALINRDPVKMKIYAKRFAGITDEQFPLFAAAITGRDIETALNYDISKNRSDKEIANMKSALNDGKLLVDLMSILAKVPRVVLLILKTNDLTRNLDEVLQNPLGPERTFLILSKYCAKIVYQEDLELSRNKYWYIRIFNGLQSWLHYKETTSRLFIYDLIMLFKNWFRSAPTSV